jgi:hypothetical protein
MKILFPVLFALGALAPMTSATAQLILPGALPPSAQPTVAPPAGGPAGGQLPGGPAAAPAAPKPIAAKPPGEETVAGRQLQRNGAVGVMAIEKTANGLEIGKLALVGFQISKPTEICRVEVGGGPIGLRPAERHEGLLSFDATLEACPFSLDILDGAARVRGKTCDFTEADCRVDPSGVWGPPGAAIGPQEAKEIEHQRGRIENEARANFRALLAAAKGNKARVKEIAREQASFSSRREEICRDYAREDQHGYCASRITMAHVVALAAELHGPEKPTSGQPVKKKRPPRPKPALAEPFAPPQ